MKRYISAFLLTIFALGVMASTGNDLKGPEYKNRKPWKNPKPQTTVYIKTGESVTGPEAKNLRPLERKTGEEVAVNTVTKEKLTGPAYKNRKHFR